jgi:hypothetical protein
MRFGGASARQGIFSTLSNAGVQFGWARGAVAGSMQLAPGRLEVGHVVEREFPNRAVSLGYGVPCPIRRNMIGKVCDAYNRLRRAEPKNVAAKWVDAPAGAKLQQRALDDCRLAPPRQTPQAICRRS